MTDRELMQQALAELEHCRVFVTTREKIKHPEGTEVYDEVIEALRARLAQPESEPVAIVDVSDGRPFVCIHDQTLKAGTPLYTNQHSANRSADSAESFCKPEPVAWMSQGGDVSRSRRYFQEMGFADLMPLYIAPPQREWQGLTDEEVKATLEAAGMEIWFSYRYAARAIEAKLKEKNT